jgi:hypothetical protein
VAELAAGLALRGHFREAKPRTIRRIRILPAIACRKLDKRRFLRQVKLA